MSGETEIMLAYRKDGAWHFAPPDETPVVSPPHIVSAEPGVSLVFALFDDGDGIKAWKAGGFYENVPAKQFCLR